MRRERGFAHIFAWWQARCDERAPRLISSASALGAGAAPAALFDSESPMRFDFLVPGFRAQNHRARLVAQFLRHLIRNDAGFRIETRRNNTETADAHLHAARIDLADRD